jgi:biotin carboxylase
VTDPRPIAVAYDSGSVSAGEIAVGLADVAPIVFLLPQSPHVRQMRGVLGELGTVVELGEDAAEDGARLTRLDVAGIITFSENLMRYCAELAEAAGLLFHSERTVRWLTDKYAQRERLRAAGVDSVRSRLVPDADSLLPALREVGFPAVLKPVRGQGSRETFPVADEKDAAALRARLFGGADRPPAPADGFVAEQRLIGRPCEPHGDYVSVETAAGPDGIVPIAVTGKHPLVAPFRETGQFWPAALSEQDRREAVALAVRAVRALDVRTGLCHTELKLTADGPRIIEVNGRLGGHLNELSRRACGTDLVRSAGLLALGRPLPHGYLSPDAVYFQHNGLGPTEPCRFAAVHGADAVRRVPGITGYRTYVRPGQRLAGGVDSAFLDLLTGRAENHAAMAEVLGAAVRRLTYEFTNEE